MDIPENTPSVQIDTDLREEVNALRNNEELLQERLAELELQNEDREYLRLSFDADREFSREGLRRICRLARIYALKNPLIRRGVEVQRLYVWGQGMNVKAQNNDVNAVLQAFMDDYKNMQELTSHEARMMKETELQTDGNIFFVFFTNESTGRTRLRTIPVDEILDIITDKNDRKSNWYYKRQWTDNGFDVVTGSPLAQQHTEYYPDWHYYPVDKPATIGGYRVNWDQPIYHVKVGGFSDMRFGIPEIYAALDWARAYKTFLENWSSIVAAYARFAWQLKTTGGAQGVAAAKAKLGTTIGNGQNGAYLETNPPSTTAATFISGQKDVAMEPVRTSGATTSSSDGRPLLLMVAAVAGLPETFFGDATAGSLATARSLDRPTELKMKDRQTLWAGIHDRIFDYVVLKAVEAPSGALAKYGMVVEVVEDGLIEKHIKWGANAKGEDISDHIDIEFAPLVQLDMDKMIAAIIDSATLGAAGTLAGTLDLETLTRMLLIALGQDDVDEMLARLFPKDDKGNPIPPNPMAAKLEPVQPVPGVPSGANTVGRPGTPGIAPAVPANESLTEAIPLEPHSGAMIGFFLNTHDARQITPADNELPKGAVREDTLHLTLAFLGKTADLEAQKQTIIDAVDAFAAAHAPMVGVTQGVGKFIGVEDGATDCLYASYDAANLAQFRTELVAALSKAGVSVATNHGFVPHIALAYVPQSDKLPEMSMPAVPITFTGLTLAWGQEHHIAPLKGTSATSTTESLMIEAVRDMRDVIQKIIKESHER